MPMENKSLLYATQLTLVDSRLTKNVEVGNHKIWYNEKYNWEKTDLGTNWNVFGKYSSNTE